MRPSEVGQERNEQATDELPVFRVQPVCPALGLRHDPASCALLPRPDHICTLPQAPSPSLAWQARYCLGDYEACPWRRPGSRQVAARRSSKRWHALGLALLVLGLFGLGIWRFGLLSFSIELTRGLPTVAPVGGRSGAAPGADTVPALTLPTPTPISRPAVAPSVTVTWPSDALVRSPTTTASVTPTPTATPEATATPLPSPKPTAVRRQHVVQDGETLSEIAERYGTTVEEIVALNGIQDPNAIAAGTVLEIPPPATQP